MKAIDNTSEFLNSFKNLLPYLPSLFDDDVSLSITDTEKFIAIENTEKMSIQKISIGDPISKGGAAEKAIKTGNIAIMDLDKNIYGYAFKSYAIPLKDEKNNIVGTLLAGKSMDKRLEVLDLSQNISSSLQQISAVVQETTIGIQSILEDNQNILKEVTNATENAKETDNIIKFIKNISSQTNILGLNASIEAARVGNLGKGFGVVAVEIRKLSNSTNESIKEIDKILKSIEQSVTEVTYKIANLNSFLDLQTTAFQEVNDSIELLSHTAQTLEHLSKRI